MKTFELLQPTSVDETTELLHQYGDDAKLMAGGTSLVLLMKQQLAQPSCIISLQRVAELSHISENDGALHLGPLVTHRAIETSEPIASRLPLLHDTAAQVATIRVRNQATIGGNLAHADPALDPPPSLLALDSSVRLRSKTGQRTVPLDEFFVDYYETQLHADELIEDIVIPFPSPRTGGVYLKYLPRTADDYATVGVAARVCLDEDLDRVLSTRIVFSGMGSTVVRAHDAESLLAGERPEPDAFEAVAASATQSLSPVGDARGSSSYKRAMAKVVVRRALERASQKARDHDR